MPTSSVADSVASVQQYVRNARAVLDSLTRYEFAKRRNTDLVQRYTALQTENLGLGLDRAQCFQQLTTAVGREAVARADADAQRRKKGAARLQVWLWRVAAAGLVYERYRAGRIDQAALVGGAGVSITLLPLVTHRKRSAAQR